MYMLQAQGEIRRTSENAGKTRVWVAAAFYVLVAIGKKQLGPELSLYKILQILSVTVFEKTFPTSQTSSRMTSPVCN